MEDTRELIVLEQADLRLGTMRSESPLALIRQATDVATELAKIIQSRKLFTSIGGKRFVNVEGWTTLGAMLGILPREDSVTRLEDGSYEAAVSLIRVSDGAVIGHGSALCGMDEKTWASRPNYARRSMAITRATGKAFRLGFSWIMTLAGYEPTPAEEMEGVSEQQREAKAANGAQPERGPVSAELWDGLAPPADFTELWGQRRFAELGYKSMEHAKNAYAKVHPDTPINKAEVGAVWATLVEYAKAKQADAG